MITEKELEYIRQSRSYKAKPLEKEAMNGAALGALLGAGLGGVTSYLRPHDKDQKKWKEVLMSTLVGAGLGGIAGYGYDKWSPGSVNRTFKRIAYPDGEALLELGDKDIGTDLPDGVYRADQLSRMGGRVATKALSAGTPFIKKKTWTTENGSKIDAYYAISEDPNKPGNPLRNNDGKVLAENNGKAIYTVTGETSAYLDNTFDDFVRQPFFRLIGK